MSDRPVLAIAATREPLPDGIRPLVRALSEWAEVRPLRRANRPAALLATSPAALTAAQDLGPLPVAVWLRSEADAALVETAATVAVVAGRTSEQRRPVSQVPVRSSDRLGGGSNVVVVPLPAVELVRQLPVAPLVRARWRERLGLPKVLVGFDEAAVPHASVMAATGPTALRALAAAAPLVTDAATAAWLGATDEVVMAAAGTLAETAEELARRDDSELARLSRLGRALAERLDIRPAAAELATRLGLRLPPRPVDPVARLEARLAELAAPEAGAMRARVNAVLAPLVAAGSQEAP